MTTPGPLIVFSSLLRYFIQRHFHELPTFQFELSTLPHSHDLTSISFHFIYLKGLWLSTTSLAFHKYVKFSKTETVCVSAAK